MLGKGKRMNVALQIAVFQIAVCWISYLGVAGLFLGISNYRKPSILQLILLLSSLLVSQSVRLPRPRSQVPCLPKIPHKNLRKFLSSDPGLCRLEPSRTSGFHKSNANSCMAAHVLRDGISALTKSHELKLY